MATVWLAEDEKLRRRVAVKRLHGDVTDHDVVRRFQREAQVGASLNHPNVVAVYDIAPDDEGVVIVMEYVEGRTLRDEIADGPLPPDRALPILRGVAEALDHAHGHGVLHRDVKPANVLLRKDGAVKLADLGIATAAEHSRITRSGAVLGTAAYMAPERLEGADGGAAADVYALAAVAFEALTGRKPIEGSTPLEVAQRVVNQPAPDVREAMPSAPAAAAAALQRGLSKDPAERPPSAGGLVNELERAFAEEPPTAPTARVAPAPPAVAVDPNYWGKQQPRSNRRRYLPVLGALAALAAVALIAILASGGGDDGAKKASKPTGAHAAKTKDRGGQAPAAAAPAPKLSPADTVNGFYQHAAGHDYDAAWSMLTDNGKAQLGSESQFAADQATLRSIAFPLLRTTQQTSDTAIVQLRSSAVHANRTDHICGTIELLRSGSRWLLDAFHLTPCPTSAPRQQTTAPRERFPRGRKKGKFPKSPKPGKARGDAGAEGGD